MLARGLLALLLLAALPAPAQEVAREGGWRSARFGMTAEEVIAALPGARALPGRFDYGPMHADRAVFGLQIAGIGFTAYLQMDDGTGLLRQVLLQAVRTAEGPADFEAVLESLAAANGPPHAVCLIPGGPGMRSRGMEVVWHLPDRTTHAVFLDFRTTGVLERDPNRDYEPLEPLGEARMVIRRQLPRRLLIRHHAAGDAALDATPGCSAPELSRRAPAGE